jgi:Family of unknown function (DUF5681)
VVDDDAEPETAGRDQAGRFKKGSSGNPSGRPRGTRNAALHAMEAIGVEGAEALLSTVMQAALAGDMHAAGLLLRRLWPERRGRPLRLDLPAVATAADLPAAYDRLLRAVAAGEASPEEAQAVAALFEGQRRAIETMALEQRIAALEARSAEGGRAGGARHAALHGTGVPGAAVPGAAGAGVARRLGRLEADRRQWREGDPGGEPAGGTEAVGRPPRPPAVPRRS